MNDNKNPSHASIPWETWQSYYRPLQRNYELLKKQLEEEKAKRKMVIEFRYQPYYSARGAYTHDVGFITYTIAMDLEPLPGEMPLVQLNKGDIVHTINRFIQETTHEYEHYRRPGGIKLFTHQDYEDLRVGSMKLEQQRDEIKRLVRDANADIDIAKAELNGLKEQIKSLNQERRKLPKWVAWLFNLKLEDPTNEPHQD